VTAQVSSVRGGQSQEVVLGDVHVGAEGDGSCLAGAGGAISRRPVDRSHRMPSSDSLVGLVWGSVRSRRGRARADLSRGAGLATQERRGVGVGQKGGERPHGRAGYGMGWDGIVWANRLPRPFSRGGPTTIPPLSGLRPAASRRTRVAVRSLVPGWVISVISLSPRPSTCTGGRGSIAISMPFLSLSTVPQSHASSSPPPPPHPAAAASGPKPGIAQPISRLPFSSGPRLPHTPGLARVSACRALQGRR
jgi:hypothetical protein